MTDLMDLDEFYRRYTALPTLHRERVNALLGKTTPRPSPDAGRPWGNVGTVSPNKRKAARDAVDAIAKGMSE